MYLIFVDFSHLFTTIWQLSIYKFYSKDVIRFVLVHHTETGEID